MNVTITIVGIEHMMRLSDLIFMGIKPSHSDSFAQISPLSDRSLASNGVSVSKNFLAWRGRSKVRHVVYHATAAQFDVFDTSKGDLGAHFGDLDQMKHLESRLSSRDGGMLIMPVWLKLENPIRLVDTGTFHADGIAIQLEKKKILKKGEGVRIAKECDTDWRLRKKYDAYLRQKMVEHGYDGVVYRNKHEGGGDSFIIFDPRQVKSALGNSGLYLKDSSSLSDFDQNRELLCAYRAKMAASVKHLLAMDFV